MAAAGPPVPACWLPAIPEPSAAPSGWPGPSAAAGVNMAAEALGPTPPLLVAAERSRRAAFAVVSEPVLLVSPGKEGAKGDGVPGGKVELGVLGMGPVGPELVGKAVKLPSTWLARVSMRSPWRSREPLYQPRKNLTRAHSAVHSHTFARHSREKLLDKMEETNQVAAMGSWHWSRTISNKILLITTSSIINNKVIVLVTVVL